MATITVESVGDEVYGVTVTEDDSSSRHEVKVDAIDVERLGAGASVEDLIEASFRFLLDREPKESIMSKFDLTDILNFFPEYDSRIGEYL